jgi:hypothetical protein
LTRAATRGWSSSRSPDIGHRAPANPRLRELCHAIQAASQRIGSVIFTWVPAEANARAHALVAEALGAQR